MFFVFKVQEVGLHKIIDVLCDFYAADSIQQAKRVLRLAVDEIHTDIILPQLRDRRDNDIRARAKKDATDILQFVETLDSHGLIDVLPRFATDNVDNVPTLRIEDGELKYFACKVDKMEAAIFQLQESVNKLYAIAASGPGLGFGTLPVGHALLATPSCSTSTVAADRPTCSAGPGVASAASVSAPVQSTVRNGRLGSVHLAERVHSPSGRLIGQPMNWADCPVSASSAGDSDVNNLFTPGESADNDDEGGYTLVESRRRRKRRRNVDGPTQRQATGDNVNVSTAVPASSLQPSAGPAGRILQRAKLLEARADPHRPAYSTIVQNGPRPADETQKPKRKPLIVGKLRTSPSSSPSGQQHLQTCGITAAKPLYGKATYCVDNVSTTVTEDDMKRFVKQLGVRVLICSKTKPRRTFKERRDNVTPSDRIAFFLCINGADKGLLLDSSKWPADVSLSPWYFKKKDGNEQGQQPPPPRDNTTTVNAQRAGVDDTAAAAAVEEMNVSPTHADLQTVVAAVIEHSGEYDEARETIDSDDIHNSTAVEIVELSVATTT